MWGSSQSGLTIQLTLQECQSFWIGFVLHIKTTHCGFSPRIRGEGHSFRIPCLQHVPQQLESRSATCQSWSPQEPDLEHATLKTSLEARSTFQLDKSFGTNNRQRIGGALAEAKA